MSLEAHQQALRIKHHTLESEIQSEHKSPFPNNFIISTLKKQKLRIKEELEGIRMAMRP